MVYEKILDLLDLMMQAGSSRNRKIMRYLDSLKDGLPGTGGLLAVEFRINGLIKKGDLPIEPT